MESTFVYSHSEYTCNVRKLCMFYIFVSCLDTQLVFLKNKLYDKLSKGRVKEVFVCLTTQAVWEKNKM